MAATLDRHAEASLQEAQVAESAARVAERTARGARVRFIRDAKSAGWTWARMGRALAISDNAVRRFWRDNRMTATRLGGQRDGQTQLAAKPQAHAGRDEGASAHRRDASPPGGETAVHDGA